MLKIGSRIKRLRMEKDARQNALAAYLDVDARLIDDWEQDRSLPPLELLPKLAAFFETTTDELLCMDSYFDEGYQKEIIAEYGRLIADNHISQAADKMRAAVRAHPKNWQFKVMLQYALYLLCDQPNMIRWYASELKQLHDEIIAGCPDDLIRVRSRRLYALHLWTDLGAADDALGEVMRLPGRSECRENALPSVTDGRRRLSALKNNIFDSLLDAFRDAMDLADSGGNDAETAACLRAAAGMIESAVGDGEAGTLAAPLCRAYLRLAEIYASSGSLDEAVKAFSRAVDRAVYFDELPESWAYPSGLLSGLTRRVRDMEPEPLTPWISDSALRAPWAEALTYRPEMAGVAEKLGREAAKMRAAAEEEKRLREERINARAAGKRRPASGADGSGTGECGDE